MPSVTSFKVNGLELLDGVKYKVFGDALYALNSGAVYEEVMLERPGTTPWWVRKQVTAKTVPLQVLLLRGDAAQRKLDYDSLLAALRPTSDATLFDVRWVEFGVIRKVQAAALEVGPGPWYQRAMASLVVPNPFPSQSFAGEVLATNGVTAYYRLGESSGTTLVDYLGGTYSGSLYNTPTLGVTGALTGDTDTAMTFASASTEYARSSATFTLAGTSPVALSLECWIKTTDATATTRTAMAHAGAASTTYNASLTKATGTPSKITLNVLNAPTDTTAITSVTSNKTINDGNWHHVVGTIQKGFGAYLYVDGILDNKTTHLLSTWSPAAGYAQIAGINATAGIYWEGSLDEVAFYNRALADGEVAAHYAAGITAL